MPELLKSKVPSLTLSTKNGPSILLDVDETIAVEEVADNCLQHFRDDEPGYGELAEFVSNGAPTKSATQRSPAPTSNPGPSQPEDPSAGSYDPSEHKVAEVLEYLDSAPPEEVARVKEAEANGGRAGGPSKQIADFEPSGDGSNA